MCDRAGDKAYALGGRVLGFLFAEPCASRPKAELLEWRYPAGVLVHLNGNLVEHDRALVSPFDHGFLFGDGVYEGLRAFGVGAQISIVGERRHAQRFGRGLAACGINWDAGLMGTLTRELLAANGLRDAFVYWQVTRGTPDLSRGPVRSRVPGHVGTGAGPGAGAGAGVAVAVGGVRSAMPPTVFGYCSPMPRLDLAGGVPVLKRASLEPDLRWHLGHIKSTSLLGNVMAAISGATEHAADEALFVRTVRDAGGAQRELLAEGSYTNVVVVTGTGNQARWLTPNDQTVSILGGVTRDLLLDAVPRLQKADVPRADVLAASEVLLVGTTTMVTTVSHLDGREIATEPGPVARQLYEHLCRAIETEDGGKSR